MSLLCIIDHKLVEQTKFHRKQNCLIQRFPDLDFYDLNQHVTSRLIYLCHKLIYSTNFENTHWKNTNPLTTEKIRQRVFSYRTNMGLSGFHLSVDRDKWLVLQQLRFIIGWKLAPLSNQKQDRKPIESHTRCLLLRVICIYLLVYCIVCVLCDWLEWLLWVFDWFTVLSVFFVIG